MITTYCNICECLECGPGEDCIDEGIFFYLDKFSFMLMHPNTCLSSVECIQVWFADGMCDAENDRVECNFDGGDCADEGVSCDFVSMNDGHCDAVNNNAACEYDGIDCCLEGVDCTYCDVTAGTCNCVNTAQPTCKEEGEEGECVNDEMITFFLFHCC